MPQLRPALDGVGAPTAPPSPRAALFWDGTYWRMAAVDAAGHLQMDAVTIAGLDGALQSVATDRLIVRGEDQLFSFRDVLATGQAVAVSGADGYTASPAVPGDEIWVVTTVAARLWTRPTTAHTYWNHHDGVSRFFYHDTRAIGTAEWTFWGGHTYLDASDVIRVSFAGCLAGDSGEVVVTGYRMTLET